ncbi:MAG: exodeoxyribonuclease VII large subunit [Gaiellaceae bacterium]
MTVEATLYGDRKVFSVAAFNHGVGTWLRRLPEVWVDGEVMELRRHDAWANVFFTLKDPASGACLSATMQRRRFDALDLGLTDGERVQVQGRPELYEVKGELTFRAATIERFGVGEHLAALERLKRALATEGVFAAERKRRLPRFPRAVGVLTGADAAARGDVLAGIEARFPPAHVIVVETRVQGRGAPERIVAGLRALAAHPSVDVVVLARGGGSFEDLLPFSDERVVRAVAACPVPIVSAVGHEQDTPLCDLAADVRASTPTAAARLVVPALDELQAGLERSRLALGRSVRQLLARDRERLGRLGERFRTSPRVLLERRRLAVEASGARLQALSPLATLARGYAIVRLDGAALRDAAEVSAGARVDVELAVGGFAARVEEVGG